MVRKFPSKISGKSKNYGTSETRIIQPKRKINWNGNSRLKIFEKLSITRKVVLFVLEIPEHAVPFAIGNF